MHDFVPQRRIRKIVYMFSLFTVIFLGACMNEEATDVDVVEVESRHIMSQVQTDKARYYPGDSVHFQLAMNEEGQQEGTLHVRYNHLGDVIESERFAIEGESEWSWEWFPPEDDFVGYMVEIILEQDDTYVDHANIAVDVSSDWSKFPRYGYLSEYGHVEEEQMEQVMERLNRFHLNALQFYDWQYKHHQPLKWENGELAEEWPDIANRTVSLRTVERYIELAHDHHMQAMNYNLLFGAYDDAEDDGVSPQWGLYVDQHGMEQDRHPLPNQWASDIYLYDPGNEAWQDYFLRAQEDVFEQLDFDGWHADQLGYRGGMRYDADGELVVLSEGYKEMMRQASERLDVDFVLNAVDQFGQQEIAQSPVDVLYTEVWDSSHYADLKAIIDENWQYSDGQLNSVLAAYMNYDLADRPGYFNTPGVLLTNAVIFAAGGAHIELGESMLAKEYFPNRNLRIPEELEQRLITYYDFLVAYQNVLRDNVQEIDSPLRSETVDVSTTAKQGSIWTFSKEAKERHIHHLLNFTNATTMEWKDNDGTQAEPEQIENIDVTIDVPSDAERVWMATPDAYSGSPVSLPFEQSNGQITVTVPTLTYWSMLVVEYAS